MVESTYCISPRIGNGEEGGVHLLDSVCVCVTGIMCNVWVVVILSM